MLNSASYGNEVYIVCSSPLTMLSEGMVDLDEKYLDEMSILVGDDEDPDSAVSFWEAIQPQQSNRKSQS